MTTALIWIIVGLVLIISELLATSVVAVFFGIGAIVTGILLHFDLIESTAAQYLVFGLVTGSLLLLARGKMKRWFVGYTKDKDEHQSQLRKDIGERVQVHTDFVHGKGRVILNGVQWDAVSDDPLKQGDVAFVTYNEGIRLTVSATRPEQA